MDGTITIPDELTVAERAIRRVAEELTAELRRKHPGLSIYGKAAYVDFWIGGSDVVAFLHGPERSGRGATFAEAAEWARRYIADLPDPNACDPWFDPAHPMNQVAA